MPWGKHRHFTMDGARQRFLAKIKRQKNGCWIWTGAVGSHGRYGSVGVAGRSYLAHRAAWFLFKGKDAGTLCVCHTCDNGLCVNPDHLFVGTQGDNVHDMEQKRRAYHPSGENHGRAKLSADDVRTIRSLHKAGASIRGLARIYPVDRATISAVVNRHSWITT